MTVMCDLCSDLVDSCWTYTTKNVASSAEDCVAGGGFWAEDPEWAVCSTCHRILTEGTGEELFEYAWRLQCLKSGTDPLSQDPKVQARGYAVASILHDFLDNQDPDHPPYFEKDVSLHGQ